MEKQDLTLEEILDEYAPQSEKKTPPVKPVSPPPAPEEETAEPPLLRRPPAGTGRTKISFLESDAAEAEPMPMRVNGSSGGQRFVEPEPEKPPVFSADTPKIRRMSDSTRAREIAKDKKRKKRSARKEKDYTYEKERPEGEYLYTQIHGARKARSRRKNRQMPDLTAAGTETIHLDLRDVVTVSQTTPVPPVEPVEVPPAPRAAKTSIDLSAGNAVGADSIDVDIRRTREEAEAETRRRQEITNSMDLDNVSDIRHDIAELRGAINFRTGALFLVLLVSGLFVIGGHFQFNWVMQMHPVMRAVIECLLTIAAAVACAPVLKNGFSRLFRFRADTDSLGAVALVGCFAADIGNFIMAVGGKETLPYYLPCTVLALFLHTAGKLLIIRREETNLRLAASRTTCSGLSIIEDEQRADALARGVLGDFPIMATMRRTDSLIDFRKYTYSADMADHFCRYAAPLATLFSIAAAVALTVLRADTIVYGLRLFSMFTAASSAAAITFVVNLPLLKATRQMTKNGALMLGYQSVDDFYDTNALLVDAESLFPDGSVTLAGVKIYANIKPERTLLTAASLARCASSVFGKAFDEALQGKEYKLSRVENYVYEDSMGLCGWIDNQRVLLGNRELMESHSIEGLPSRAREAEMVGVNQEAVYLSVSGSLSAMFLVQLKADRNVKFWAKQAARHNICLILRSVDPMLTLAGLSSLLEVPQSILKIIPAKLHEAYEAETAPVREMSASMACSGSFSGVAQLIIGAKVIRHAAVYGIFIQAAAILLGLGLVLLEGLLNVGISPARLLLVQLAASLITLIAVNIRRTY